MKVVSKQKVISDVEPRGSYNCVMNVVITDKRNGQIVRKTNNTPKNPGMNGKQFHVQTPQDIHHILKEATIFSEMDMGWGFTNLFKMSSPKTRRYSWQNKDYREWREFILTLQHPVVHSTVKLEKSLQLFKVSQTCMIIY